MNAAECLEMNMVLCLVFAEGKIGQRRHEYRTLTYYFLYSLFGGLKKQRSVRFQRQNMLEEFLIG